MNDLRKFAGFAGFNPAPLRVGPVYVHLFVGVHVHERTASGLKQTRETPQTPQLPSPCEHRYCGISTSRNGVWPSTSMWTKQSPFQGRKTRHPSGLWAAIAPRRISGRFRANNGSFRRKFRPNGHTERPPCYSEFVLVRGGRSRSPRGPPEMAEETFS